MSKLQLRFAQSGLPTVIGHVVLNICDNVKTTRFLDDKLDFDLRISANGPAALLTPMYKLFEYTGEGSLKHPDWHPKRF